MLSSHTHNHYTYPHTLLVRWLPLPSTVVPIGAESPTTMDPHKECEESAYPACGFLLYVFDMRRCGKIRTLFRIRI